LHNALYSFLKEPALFDAYLLSSFGLFNESQAKYFASELGKNLLRAFCTGS
jgi:hypothetical protein